MPRWSATCCAWAFSTLRSPKSRVKARTLTSGLLEPDGDARRVDPAAEEQPDFRLAVETPGDRLPAMPPDEADGLFAIGESRVHLLLQGEIVRLLEPAVLPVATWPGNRRRMPRIGTSSPGTKENVRYLCRAW